MVSSQWQWSAASGQQLAQLAANIRKQEDILSLLIAYYLVFTAGWWQVLRNHGANLLALHSNLPRTRDLDR